MIRSLFRATLVALLTIASLAVVHTATPASADTFEVTDPSDPAVITPNTLRWAIQEANNDPNPPTIEIEPGLDIELTCAGGGALGYGNGAGHPLTIEGNGATITQTCAGNAVLTSISHDFVLRGATFAGGGATTIQGGGDVLLEDSTVADTTAGGGVTAYNGRATIVRSTLRDNTGGAGGGVGAIHVELDSSTLSGNTANNGGGAWSDQSLTITNSTISGNTAMTSGGGIYAGLNQISMAYTTIVGNTAPLGANVDLDFSAALIVGSSLIGSPLGGGENCDIDGGATIQSHGYNITSDASCGLDAGPGDEPNIDPEVGPLADNGGPTLTRLPGANSPALDHADCAALAVNVDQRGVSRPLGPACDSGSVEVEPGSDTTTTSTPGSGPGGAARPATPVALTPSFTG
jgi:hypothetical protein